MTDTTQDTQPRRAAPTVGICADRARRALYTALGLELHYAPTPTAELKSLHTLRLLGRGPLSVASRTTGRGHGGTPFQLDHVASFGGTRFGSSLGFDGLVVSRPHALRLSGRILVTRVRGPLTPRTRDGMKRISMGSSQFDALYAVYADDQTEARLVLPPDFMERLMAFADVPLRRFASVYFDHRTLHVVLPTGRALRVSDRPRFASADQATRVLSRDLHRIFALFAEVDILHAKADRHCAAETERARRDHFAARIARIAGAALPVVSPRVVQLSAGTASAPRRARPMTGHLAPVPARASAL